MDDKLQQAIAAIKAGDKQKGREIIAEVLKEDRSNEQAWLWLTQTNLTYEERIKSFKHVLRINPNNKAAKQQLAKLQGKQSQKPKKKKKKRKPIVNLVLFSVVSVFLVCICLFIFSSSTPSTSSTSSPRLGSTPISTDTPKPTPTATRVVPPTVMNTQSEPALTATRVIKPLSTNTPTPQAPSHPSGATAICRDGTYSFSTSRRGTCSHHGGVSRWLE